MYHEIYHNKRKQQNSVGSAVNAMASVRFHGPEGQGERLLPGL